MCHTAATPECAASGEPAGPPSLDWARQYLPDYLHAAPCAFHRELLRDLENPRLRLIARVAPRGHAKSTLAALVYPLWCICQRRRRNIVILTYERSLAVQFVSDIRAELETNERLRTDYGDLLGELPGDEPSTQAPAARKAAKPCEAAVPRPPGARPPGARRRALARRRDRFTTNTGITVQSRSVGGALRGARSGPQRPDLVICDDIETDALVASPRRRAALEAWLRKVVLPALAPEGRIVLLGSLLHYDSLLANLRDRQRFPGWSYRVYRALEMAARPEGGFEPRALWPARWSVARLAEERERIGTLAFEQEYMANPQDDARRVFRPEWLRPYAPRELVAERQTMLAAIDPATGAEGGDYFAVWVGSVDQETGVVYTRELRLERCGIVEQIRCVLDVHQRWRPVTIGIESTAYQVALKQMLEEISRREGLYLPIVSIQTRENKRARIEGLAPFLERGLFRLPPGLDPEAERQFLHYPDGRHDDAPDVCAMAIALARQARALPLGARTGARRTIW